MRTLAVRDDDHQRRLDRVLRKAFPHVPPGALARAVRQGSVRVNGRRCRHNGRLQEGDIITTPSWEAPAGEPRGEPPRASGSPRLEGDRIIAGSREILILEQTPHRIALSKPRGLLSQGQSSPGQESLDQIVREVARARGWWKESLSFRPGPVHRLDRNTTGVQLFALSIRGARELSQAFQTPEGVIKLYLTVLEGNLAEPLLIDLPLCYLNGKRKAYPRGSAPDHSGEEPLRYAPAQTEVIPLAWGSRSTLAAAIPHTGRTHQIRCHCAAAGYPLEGDRKYQPPDRRAGTTSRGSSQGSNRNTGSSADPYRNSPQGPGRYNPGYILHARTLIIPAIASWRAPLPPEVTRHLAKTFGDTEQFLARADTLASRGCAGSSRSGTIEP
ncbi:RluA family pseudouridine synthase [Alkalispirochaeta sphaeroplastigenens]|uniref:RluA family pseudouridine synthase n=1 Tax=Alkalispirochaeta sphaeroplastigenens TaxID=1187066 RepID=UPI0011AF1FDA|nr:RluA family pseudouridine synthase [Alkalispirochaeta sphaeroplastigenens]